MGFRDEVRLDEPADYQGVWRLDFDGAIEFPGTLSYTPTKGLQLRAAKSHVESPQFTAFALGAGNSRMLGKIAGGRTSICLLYCWVQESSSLQDEIRFYAQQAIVGREQPWEASDDALIVDHVSVTMPNLADWLGWPKWPDMNKLQRDGLPMITLASSGEDECKSAEGGLADFGGGVSFGRMNQTAGIPDGMSLTAIPSIDVLFDTPKTIVESQWIAARTCFLLNLLIGCNSPMRSLALGKGREDYRVLNRSKSDLPSKDCYKHPLSHPADYDFPAVLDRWLSLSNESPAIATRLMSLLWKWSSLLDDELSVAVQACEGLAGKRHGEKYLSKDKHKALVAKLMDAMKGQSQELINRASGSFEWLNAPSLSTLLQRLLQSLPPTVIRQATAQKEGESLEQCVKRFVRIVNKSRNDIAHGREYSPEEGDKGGLLMLIARLKTVLVCCLLIECGLSIELVEEKFSDPHQWLWG